MASSTKKKVTYPSAEFSILTSGSMVESSMVCMASLWAVSPMSPPDVPFAPHSSHFQLKVYLDFISNLVLGYNNYNTYQYYV